MIMNWNTFGDIIKMERHGCEKYIKKEEQLYGCLPGRVICRQPYTFGKYIEDVYNLDISEGMKAKIRQTKNIGKSKHQSHASLKCAAKSV